MDWFKMVTLYPKKCNYVCSKHFREIDFEIYNSKRVLKKHALPQIFEKFPAGIVRKIICFILEGNNSIIFKLF